MLNSGKTLVKNPAILFYSRLFNTNQHPAPPLLSKEDQDEFETLQRIAQSQDVIEEYNKQFDDNNDSTKSTILRNNIEEFHPEFFKTIPEFSGDKNPITGEIGGPKQDPLKHGDYSFNGRVTDF